jgi:hypothetical protein
MRRDPYRWTSILEFDDDLEIRPVAGVYCRFDAAPVAHDRRPGDPRNRGPAWQGLWLPLTGWCGLFSGSPRGIEADKDSRLSR